MKIETRQIYEVGDRFQTNRELAKLQLFKGIYMILKVEPHPTQPQYQILTCCNSNQASLINLSSEHLTYVKLVGDVVKRNRIHVIL